MDLDIGVDVSQVQLQPATWYLASALLGGLGKAATTLAMLLVLEAIAFCSGY
jgi:hypothetical protein